MLVVTTENVAGHRVAEVKGECFGVVVRSRGLGGNIMAGLRSQLIRITYDPTCLLNRNPAMSKRLVAAAGNVALG